jgi:prepilin-type N-terminal cleavage/methylation domain-containing protein
MSWKKSNRKMLSGFTLVEVLVTLLLIGIVIPAIMNAITTATAAGGSARTRNDAAQLAKSQMALLLAGTQWQTSTNLSGDFSPDWPQYHWKAEVQPWNQDTSGMGIEQIDLTITWLDRGRQQSMLLTSVAYPRIQEVQQQ